MEPKRKKKQMKKKTKEAKKIIIIKMKNLYTSPELNVGMRATKLQKSTEKATQQQAGSATNSQTHTNSLSPLSLSLHCQGLAERRKKTAPSAFRNGMPTRTPY
jgi:hypothetical protein